MTQNQFRNYIKKNYPDIEIRQDYSPFDSFFYKNYLFCEVGYGKVAFLSLTVLITLEIALQAKHEEDIEDVTEETIANKFKIFDETLTKFTERIKVKKMERKLKDIERDF